MADGAQAPNAGMAADAGTTQEVGAAVPAALVVSDGANVQALPEIEHTSENVASAMPAGSFVPVAEPAQPSWVNENVAKIPEQDTPKRGRGRPKKVVEPQAAAPAVVGPAVERKAVQVEVAADGSATVTVPAKTAFDGADILDWICSGVLDAPLSADEKKALRATGYKVQLRGDIAFFVLAFLYTLPRVLVAIKKQKDTKALTAAAPTPPFVPAVQAPEPAPAVQVAPAVVLGPAVKIL